MFKALCAFAAALVLASNSFGAPVADTTADYSGVQGQNNWYYGYWAGSGVGYSAPLFTQMAAGAFNGSVWDFGPSPNFLTIGANTWHPNGGSGTGAVQTPMKRWIAEDDGTLTISGQWRSNDTTRGAGLDALSRNGTTARIYHEGVQVYSQKIAWTAFPSFTNYSVAFDVLAGDRIDFAIHYDGDVNDDSTFFSASLDLIPPPVVPLPPALAAGLLCLGLAARRSSRR